MLVFNFRANQSPEAVAEDRERERLRIEKARANQSPEAVAEDRGKNRVRTQSAR